MSNPHDHCLLGRVKRNSMLCMPVVPDFDHLYYHPSAVSEKKAIDIFKQLDFQCRWNTHTTTGQLHLANWLQKLCDIIASHLNNPPSHDGDLRRDDEIDGTGIRQYYGRHPDPFFFTRYGITAQLGPIAGSARAREHELHQLPHSRLRLVCHAHKQLLNQPFRFFLHTFRMDGLYVRPFRFDRSGGLAGNRYHIRENPIRFIRMLSAFLQMTRTELGHDRAIHFYKAQMLLDAEGETFQLIHQLRPAPSAVDGQTSVSAWLAFPELDRKTLILIKDTWSFRPTKIHSFHLCVAGQTTGSCDHSTPFYGQRPARYSNEIHYGQSRSGKVTCTVRMDNRHGGCLRDADWHKRGSPTDRDLDQHSWQAEYERQLVLTPSIRHYREVILAERFKGSD